MHLTKIATYGAGDLRTGTGLALRRRAHPGDAPRRLGWPKIVGRISDRVFILLVEISLLAKGILFLIGL